MGISFNAASLLNGNGINVDAIVSEIQSASSGQLTLWNDEQSTLQTQASALSTINTDLTNLQTAVNALSDPVGAFSSLTASSSLPAVATATASSAASVGSHTLVLSSLATSGTVYTDALTNADTSILPSGAASGDIKLQVGGSSGTTYDIPITQGSNDTINTLVSYINQQSTQHSWGVTASVLTDATGARLAISSQNSGTTGALAITANTTFDSNGNDTGNPTNLTFLAPVGGTNATFTVDSIPFSSTSNTVTDAIPGVTLNLVSAYSGQVQISVSTDTSAINSAISSFVSAYNTLANDINTQFKVDPSTGAQGPLGSDSSLRSLQSSILSDVTYAISGNNGLVNLASLGIDMGNDGTLSIDAQTLSSALTSNPSAVQNFFQNSTSTGFANNFSNDLSNLTDPTQGVLNVDLAQNQATQNDIADQISNFQDQLAAQKQQLEQEFSQVNASLEEYPYLLQEVTEQLGLSTSSSSSTGTTPTSGTSTSS